MTPEKRPREWWLSAGIVLTVAFVGVAGGLAWHIAGKPARGTSELVGQAQLLFGWAQLALAAVLAWTTIFYTRETRGMVREMREARKAAIAPALVLELHHVGPTVAMPWLVNVGQGAAIDINAKLVFEPVPGTDAAREERPYVSPLMRPRDHDEFFTPEWPEHPTALMDAGTLAARYRSVSIEGTMRNALGELLEFRAAVDDLPAWQELSGLAALTYKRPPEDVANDTLAKLQKELEQIRRGLARPR